MLVDLREITADTVRLITVTLAGLIAGLGLPHFAVMTTLFAFALIYIFDTNPACRIKVEGLNMDRAADCAAAYREQLKLHRCKIIAERQSLEKKRIEFVFRLPRHGTRDRLNVALSGDLAAGLDSEAYGMLRCRASEDHKEAAQAFVEKRAPVFRGR